MYVDFCDSNFLTEMCSFGHVTQSMGRSRVGFRRMRCLVCEKGMQTFKYVYMYMLYIDEKVNMVIMQGNVSCD